MAIQGTPVISEGFKIVQGVPNPGPPVENLTHIHLRFINSD